MVVRWLLLGGTPNSLAINLSCQAVEKFQVCFGGIWFPSISLLEKKRDITYTPYEGEDDIILPSPSYN
jgi:hypothetical protein